MLFTVVGIFMVVWLVVIGLRYMDEYNLRQNFAQSNNLFVLADDGSPVTGFVTKEGLAEPDIDSIEDEIHNPNSDIYDDYYKVVFIEKDMLPEKIQLVLAAAEPDDQLLLFQNYVERNIMEGDTAKNLISLEQNGDIAVYRETLAFRHGISDILGS